MLLALLIPNVRWFGHWQRKHVDATVRKSNLITVNGNVRGRGRTELTWYVVVVRKDVVFLNLTERIIFDRVEWWKKIYVD